MFKCDSCVMSFARKDVLARHHKTHGNIRFTCDKCPMVFTRKDALVRHDKNIHGMY